MKNKGLPKSEMNELTERIEKLFKMNPIDTGLIESLKEELMELTKSKRISPTEYKDTPKRVRIGNKKK